MNIKSFKIKVRLYSIVVGIEQFIEIANKYPFLDRFVKEECFVKKGLIFVYIKDYINGLSTLDRLMITSIGIGNTKPTAISNNLNIKEKMVRESLN